MTNQTDSTLDLTFERIVDVPPEPIWRAWTTPELLKQWFTPAPWKTVGCEIELRPGGAFNTVMESPEGQQFPGKGCILEVIPNRKLVWTSVMTAGYRPAVISSSGDTCDFPFTGIISLELHGSGTRYRATVLHADEAGAKKHAAMGFEEGWGKAFEQLIDLIKRQP